MFGSRKLNSVCATFASALAIGLWGMLPAVAEISDEAVRIGILTDESGMFAAITGPGSILAARMAVEDFGGEVSGVPIEVVHADHQNRADVGSAIARRWFESDGVDIILDVPNSSVALAVQELAREFDRIFIASGPGSAALTGEACSPVGMHWTWDTYANAVSTGRAIVEEGGDTWFFITADYAFGHASEEAVSRVVEQAGGSVVGSVRHPVNTHDFSSFLLQAQASGAKIIGMANGGDDSVNSIRQAAEFGITRAGQQLAGLALFIGDVHGIGLESAQDLLITTAFYWDLDDETREWSKRFMERNNGVAPTMTQAGVYSAVMHYLKAIDVIESDDANEVVAQMRSTPVEDFFARGGYIREDGRMVHDMHLVRVKSPEESQYAWDYYEVLRTIPGDEAFRPIDEGGCPLVGN